jgi:hypothetical protein
MEAYLQRFGFTELLVKEICFLVIFSDMELILQGRFFQVVEQHF